MTNIRKKHTIEFKTKVAIDAIRQQKTTNELTSEYGVHATQINSWKRLALEAIPLAFSGSKERLQHDHQTEIDELYRQLGQVVAERDWLKKKSTALR